MKYCFFKLYIVLVFLHQVGNFEIIQAFHIISLHIASNDSLVLLNYLAFFVRDSAMPSIINPDWDFTKMGIGGLDEVRPFQYDGCVLFLN